MLKAVREAKTRTSWVNPDAAYEDAVKAFVTAVLEPSDDAPFLSDVARFVSRIAMAAAWNSLARVAIHLTAPGVPDIYQGDDSWNFSLVDPDNRRPVDYGARAALVTRAWSDDPDPFDSATKLGLTRALLHLRRERPTLFGEGAYRRLVVRGPRAEHIVAFARSLGNEHAITVAGRLLCTRASASDDRWWGDTSLELPDDLAGISWRSIPSGQTVQAASSVAVAPLLSALPTAVLAN
jgi:(1->4)-alpha-D-glucan 1-alpha-D-glucosylmutase